MVCDYGGRILGSRGLREGEGWGGKGAFLFRC